MRIQFCDVKLITELLNKKKEGMDVVEGKENVIPAEKFEGKRQATNEETEYLKGFFLREAQDRTSFFFVLIMLCVVWLPLKGIRWCIQTLINNYYTIGIHVSVGIGLSVLIIVLCTISGFGVWVLVNHFTNDVLENKRFKRKIISGQFRVVDVEVVGSHIDNVWDSNGCDEYYWVEIADLYGNVADKSFIVYAGWNEIKGTGKAFLILIKEDGDVEKALGGVVPRYDKRSVFCSKQRNFYMKKYKTK